MSKKATVKRPRTAKPRKVASSKKVETSTLPLSVNAKEREDMLEALVNSDHEDIAEIAKQYSEGDKEKKELLRTHYERNGNEFTIALFHGNRKRVKELATVRDQKLL